MFDKIRRLGTETAIYGISTILGRFLNFLLVPFYTNVLAPGEYGIVAYVYSIIAFANVLYSYGMETAYFKYSSTLEVGTPRQNFSTPFVSLLSTSVVFSLITVAFASPISDAIDLPPNLSSIVSYAAAILALDAIAIIPFAALRMEHKAKAFAAIKFLNIVVNVAMNLMLVIVFRMGVVGVFVSGVVASAATILMLAPVVARHVTAEFNTSLWKALLKFAFPYVPAGLASMALQVIDRPILRALTDDATVGIYQANYRLGIFMMLVVSMYDYAWRPFYFATAKEPNAKETFARVLTYLVLFMSGVFLILTFFIDDVARVSIFGRHLIGSSYWSGLSIVPIVMLGYLFLGISTNLSAGIYIETKTQYAPLATIVAALTNIAANYALIPSIGMTGAALATLIAYAVQAVVLYVIVQRIYPVRYELGRLSKITGAVCVVTALYYIAPVDTFLASNVAVVGWKLLLLALFAVLIYGMRFFEGMELSALRQVAMWRKLAKDTTEAETTQVET